ncbi:MAG: winged helix-turn-helix transcriptional regulator [Hamadaea sp.]|nr:winged helix-turn-helix transcriptional regulator [Hamadaea sp.]
MAVTLRFSPDDLLRSRFAISPALETLFAVRLTTPQESPGEHRRWLAEIRPRLADLDLRPITLLQPRRGYSPDFLTRPPAGPRTSFDDDLARIAGTPLDQVRQEIARSLADTPGAAESPAGRLLLDDAAEALILLTTLVRQAWHALVEPFWPQIRALLDADVAFQTRRLAEGGLDRVFAELHPQLRWHENVLIRDRGDDDHRDLHGEGVLLVPSAFKWDQVIVIVDPPWQPTVVYPARGLGTLWLAGGEPAASGDAPLSRLLGRSRASLLIGLTEPAATTVLAHRYGLAPATVSEHLTLLRDAGFLVGERHRHEIRYRRTPLGDAVVQGTL